MKIAVTARGATPLTSVDESFGRCYWFLVYEPQQEEWHALSNEKNRVREEGAGIRAAHMLIDLQVEVLITGQCGPRVQRILRAAGIDMFRASGMGLPEAVEAWKNNQLSRIEAAHCAGNPYCLLESRRGRKDRGEEKVRLGLHF